MKMDEFINKYCKEILQEASKKRKLLEDSQLTFDDKIEKDGELVRVIYAEDGTDIDIEDIFAFKDAAAFSKRYPGEAALKARNRYLDMFTILMGKDLLDQYQRQIEAERARLAHLKDISGDALTCGY